MAYTFTAPLWRTRMGESDTSWFFLTLPEAMADEIDARTTGLQGGFGSVRVRVTIGSSTWETSLFPSTEAGSYVLPVKKAARTAEKLSEADDAEVSLVVVGLD